MTTAREALAKALCAQFHECAETCDEPMQCDHGFGYRDADALLAFGVVVDIDSLRIALVDALEPFADGEPFDEQECVDGVILPALRSAISERAS